MGQYHAWLLLPVLSVGCSQPVFPSYSAPGRLAVSFLNDISTGNDAAALAKFAHDGTPPSGFDVVQFGQRADRMELLRDYDTLTLVRVEYLYSTHHNSVDPLGSAVLRALNNLFPAAAVDLKITKGDRHDWVTLEVFNDRVKRVKVGGKSFMALHQMIVMPTAPPEPKPLDTQDLALRWFRSGDAAYIGVSARVELKSRSAGLRVETLCRENNRFYRHVTISAPKFPAAGWQQADISDRVGPAELPCEVMFQVWDASRRRVTQCFENSTAKAGACRDQPVPKRTSKNSVTIDEVTADLDPENAKVLRVDYTLHPNIAFPKAHDVARARLGVLVTCADGQELTAGRPLKNGEHQLGVHQRFTALMLSADPITTPCRLEMTYTSDDDYKAVKQPVYDACIAYDGISAVPAEDCITAY